MNYMNTTMLFILMLNFIGCGQASNTTAKGPTIQHVDDKQFQSKMTEKNTVVLDVRTKDEVSEGYIKGTTLFIDVNGGDFDAQIKKLDKSKTYLVYCRSGKRSKRLYLSSIYTKQIRGYKWQNHTIRKQKS